ncbi:hypothetical protein T492DRAFT_406890 [Pavlovales sp. CCMP2436]|nr:hypothetical protein T492DRAFT_406890 [Pavlovales sp. CCMP2436]
MVSGELSCRIPAHLFLKLMTLMAARLHLPSSRGVGVLLVRAWGDHRRVVGVRYLSSDGADPTPPDFASMMNDLSAKSAAAIGRQQKDSRPAAQRAPITGPIAHGRLTEVQLQQLLNLQRDGVDAKQIQLLAHEMGVREGDPALASVLVQLSMPFVVDDLEGNKNGLRYRPHDFETFVAGENR